MLSLLLAVTLATSQDSPYTRDEVSSVLQAVDDLVRRGRFFQAVEKLREIKKPRLPAGDSARFQETEQRVSAYAELLLETVEGDIAKVPALTRIAIKNGGKPLVRITKEDGTFYHYKTLTGIRFSLAKERVDTLTALTPQESADAVVAEFRNQCGNRNLMLQAQLGKPPSWKELGGTKVTGKQYFDLAEFCARNGAGEFLAGLFDMALQRDPEIRSSAHITKGGNLLNLLFYSLTVNNETQANYALNALTSRYRDTASYKEKLYGDKEITEIVKVLLKKDVPEPKSAAVLVAKAPAEPKSPTDPAPPPSQPVPEPRPLLIGPPPEAPPPDQGAGGMPVAVTSYKLLSTTPPDILELVARGDKNFDEAMKHLLNSDPSVNPDTWSQENTKALELFKKANLESYIPAQDRYSSGVPQPLLDRVRETTMRSSLCRKRSVRHD